MDKPTLLIIGCGDLGLRVGSEMLSRGWQVHATRRNPQSQYGDIHWHAANYTNPGDLDFAADLQADYVLLTLTPSDRSVAGYQRGFADAADNLLTGLGSHLPRRILMVSSTRVYAETAGAWVDEASALSTADSRAQAIIRAEQLLLSNQATSVIRCAGIYGAPGGRLLSRVAGGEIAPAHPVRYTNRIHRQDCAGLLCHLLAQDGEGKTLENIYNGVDDLPCPAHEVESWLAAQLGVKPRERKDTASPNHKRCANAALKRSGYTLKYRDYQAGYGPLLDAFEFGD